MGLKEITDGLLQTESDVVCMQAAGDLLKLFSEIVKIGEEFPSKDTVDTQLSEGKALSPASAVRCILDFARTRAFLRGVRDAIFASQKRFPGQTIHIVYAGCGPYAPLVLPLTLLFTADQVQFTLLDIHKRSSDAVRQIVETLGLTAYVRDFVQCDASTYRPCESSAHILLIETMQKALEKEPQVAITRNLVPWLSDGGILVPERVTITACLSDLSKEFEMESADCESLARREISRERIDLGTVFELTAACARRPWLNYSNKTSGKELHSAPVKLQLPQNTRENLNLMMLTNIMVFASNVLRDYDSGLTYPTVLCDLGRIGSNDQLEFQYVTGESPGMRWRRV